MEYYSTQDIVGNNLNGFDSEKEITEFCYYTGSTDKFQSICDVLVKKPTLKRFEVMYGYGYFSPEHNIILCRLLRNNKSITELRLNQLTSNHLAKDLRKNRNAVKNLEIPFNGKEKRAIDKIIFSLRFNKTVTDFSINGHPTVSMIQNICVAFKFNYTLEFFAYCIEVGGVYPPKALRDEIDKKILRNVRNKEKTIPSLYDLLFPHVNDEDHIL